MTAYRIFAVALFLVSGTAMAGGGPAANFRVENSVFVDGQPQPQSQGVTIFHDGLVYDFLNDPAEVIVFDKPHRWFTLLDVSRHLRSDISIDDVEGFANRVKQRLSGRPQANVKWLADPSFEESFHAENAELTLKSPALTYQAQVQATATAVAFEYREFSDWYAIQLCPQPEIAAAVPAMLLNAAVERHQGIAKEVRLTTGGGPKELPVKISSRHQLALHLSPPT